MNKTAIRLLFITLPILLAVIYFGFWATDMYISEARFSLRSPEGSSSAEWLTLFGQASGSTGADAYVVQDYIESPKLLEALDGELSLKKHYQNPEADFLSRLEEDPTQEEFNDYFLKQLKIHYNQASGILKLQVQAFSPHFAQDVCALILKKSEALVNSLTERAVEDSLTLARSEVNRAEKRLASARQELKIFRQKHNLLDPLTEAGAVQGLVAELEGAVAKVRAELAEARSYMREDSARIISLKARIQALAGQIEAEKIRLTGKDQATVSSLSTKYEQLATEHEFAQKQYLSAMSSLETARIHAQRQSRYLVAFVQPTLPDEALWPRRGYAIGISVAAIFLVYGLGSLIIAAIREHAGN
jgi:capsular polysaccharide transport system permease protein